MSDIKAAAEAVLRAMDASTAAINGLGHPGEEHDRALGDDRSWYRDVVGECSACGGARYGAEDDLLRATGDLREALGQERKPWEAFTREQMDRAMAAMRSEA